ncbi:MAG TPA: SdrD B-like domain-containing protein [Gemmataceae bacterium]|nr:SdrD B-like domain-containing protein [Gemmataceae bacterium]
MEDRCVPSATVDLTTAGAIGSINGAIFYQYDQKGGTGIFDPVVRIQGHNGTGIEQGYNTDARPLQFDEKSSANYTRSLKLSSVPTVQVGGVTYREFLLGINEQGSSPFLSLDELRLFVSNKGNLSNYDPGTKTLGGQSAVYDMGAGNWVELNSRLSTGNGQSDMALYVPDAVFNGGAYVYLYSKFGVNESAQGGFEEWVIGADGNAPPIVTASLSGYVTNPRSGNGIGGVRMTLMEYDNNGNVFATFTTTTDANGFYTFGNLAPGNYSVSEDISTLPGGYMALGSSAGTVNGSTDGASASVSLITGIKLTSGNTGINYDFTAAPIMG